MKKSATPTLQASGLFQRMFGVGAGAGNSLPVRKLMDSDTPDSSAPAAPGIMGTSVSPEGRVLLLWQDPSDDSITGYQVLLGPDAAALVVIEVVACLQTPPPMPRRE